MKRFDASKWQSSLPGFTFPSATSLLMRHVQGNASHGNQLAGELKGAKSWLIVTSSSSAVVPPALFAGTLLQKCSKKVLIFEKNSCVGGLACNQHR